jgi:quercetin dioxygenase-like cupin family protein
MKHWSSSFLACLLMVGMDATAQHATHASDVLCNADGSTRVTALHRDTLCSSNLICIPQAVLPHLHRYHTEHVTVLEGTGRLLLDGDTLDIAEGDVIVIPTGTPHGVWCTSDIPLRVVSIHAPPFDGLDRVPIPRY